MKKAMSLLTATAMAATLLAGRGGGGPDPGRPGGGPPQARPQPLPLIRPLPKPAARPQSLLPMQPQRRARS